MTESSPTHTVLHADQEHNIIRLLIPIFLLVGFCLGFAALNALLDVLFPGLDSRVFVACVGAVPLGLLLTGVTETLLKRHWRSGRKVVLNEMIEVHYSSREIRHLDAGKNINLLLWYFQLVNYPRGGRERRVSSGWYCCAARMQQDDEQVIVYSFVPPAVKEDWVTRYDFHLIEPADVYDSSFLSRVTLPTRPEIPPHIIAGKSGRYWLAERERWQEGLELTPDDFAFLLEKLHTLNIHS